MKEAKLKLLFRHFRSEGLSLRRRFLLYIISAIATFLALTMVLLNLFGFLNPASVQIMRDMENQKGSEAPWSSPEGWQWRR